MEITEITNHIIKCYLSTEFDAGFSFVKIRKEKGKYKIGSYEINGKKYFYKIIEANSYNDEDVINEKIKGYFRIPALLDSKVFGSERINIYEFIDAIDGNSYNFLRRKSVSLEDKKTKLSNFFDKYIEFQRKSITKDKMLGDRKSDMWFHDRIDRTSRAFKFYGNNFEELLEKIKELVPKVYEYYAKFLGNIYTYLEKGNDLLIAYNHGDFHDFNFSLDMLFWDVDTFGYNPIVNDFAVYYWHFYGREDGLILKYSPWLIENMHNELSTNELAKVRELKKEQIIKYYEFIEDEYRKNGIVENLFDEIKFKLFCRMFLIDNIFNYDIEDFVKVVNFFGNIISKNDSDIEKILFQDNLE